MSWALSPSTSPILTWLCVYPSIKQSAIPFLITYHDPLRKLCHNIVTFEYQLIPVNYMPKITPFP